MGKVQYFYNKSKETGAQRENNLVEKCSITSAHCYHYLVNYNFLVHANFVRYRDKVSMQTFAPMYAFSKVRPVKDAWLLDISHRLKHWKWINIMVNGTMCGCHTIFLHKDTIWRNRHLKKIWWSDKKERGRREGKNETELQLNKYHLGTRAMCYKFNTSTPYGFVRDDHQLYLLVLAPKWLPFFNPGSAGGFFLLKRSFSFPLSHNPCS